MSLAETQALFWQAVRAKRAPRYLGELFVSRGALDAVQRMQIYRAAYWARHEKALQESFPVLFDQVGSRVFRRLVAGYIESHPSRETAIERAGHAFARYVACNALLGARADELGRLAQLEWARVLAVLADDAELRFVARDLGAPGATERALRMLPSLSLVRALATAVWRGRQGTLELCVAGDEALALERALAGETLSTICTELDGAARAEQVIAGWIARGWIVELI